MTFYREKPFMQKEDDSATVNNVRAFLAGHWRRTLRAGKSISSLQSPRMDGMPRSSSSVNRVDDNIIKQADIALEVSSTVHAIHCLDSKSEFILSKLYLADPAWTNTEIMQAMGYEESRYRDLKRLAFLMFAEAYSVEDLRVFRDFNDF